MLCAAVSTVAAVVVTFRIQTKWLTRMVSFSAGLLLTVALLDLLPEVLDTGMHSKTMFSILLAGLLGFFLAEKLMLARSPIDARPKDSTAALVPGHTHDSFSRPVPLILLGGSLHIFTDGLLMAAAFLTNQALGWSMTIAIIAHEIPREAGDFALLLAAGWSRAKTLIANLAARLSCSVGGVVGFFMLGGTHSWIGPVLTIAAASFLYIAIAGLFPWLRNEKGDAAWHGGFMVAGVFLGFSLPG
jgi:zinc and cadmium transporter